MTSSVLSAAMFSIMCFALPGQNGQPLLQGPSPQNLPSSGSFDSFVPSLPHADGEKTLRFGFLSGSESEESHLAVVPTAGN